jgi:hypothetical protein
MCQHKITTVMLVGQRPDVIVVGSGAATRAVQQATATIPIIFIAVVLAASCKVSRARRATPQASPICTSHLARRQRDRPAGSVSNQIPTRHQPQNLEGDRFGHSAATGDARRRGDRMKRREFIAGLGNAVAWPAVAWAQRGERVRRLGIVSMYGGSTSDDQRFLASLTQGLAELGWIAGRNLRMDVRWAGGSVDLANRKIKEDDVVVVDLAEIDPLLAKIGGIDVEALRLEFAVALSSSISNTRMPSPLPRRAA